MQRHFTLEYWMDNGWYVGKLREVPGVFSQGESLDELEDNIRDAYQMMIAEEGGEVSITQVANMPSASRLQS